MFVKNRGFLRKIFCEFEIMLEKMPKYCDTLVSKHHDVGAAAWSIV